MGLFDNIKPTNEWIVEQGIAKKCPVCGHLFDSHIEHKCPLKAHAKKDIFKNVKWLKE